MDIVYTQNQDVFSKVPLSQSLMEVNSPVSLLKVKAFSVIRYSCYGLGERNFLQIETQTFNLQKFYYFNIFVSDNKLLRWSISGGILKNN